MHSIAIIRRALKGIPLILDTLVISALTVAIIGHLLRDRLHALAALTYAPLTWISLATILYDLIRRQRTLPRKALTYLATASFFLAGRGMVGHRPLPKVEGEEPIPLRIIQQNVWWGGGFNRSLDFWAKMQSDLYARDPDILILSEAPDKEWLDEVLPKLSQSTQKNWTLSFAEDFSATWFRLAVLTPYEHHPARLFKIRQGAVLDVTALHPKGPIRIWVVDGLSHITRDRRSMFNDLVELLKEQERVGPPVDILAGDFNAPARSIGFDAFRRQYWLASEHGFGWRGTWPSFMPLVDVDHIWLLRSRWGGNAAQQFRLEGSDHRGTQVDAVWVTSLTERLDDT